MDLHRIALIITTLGGVHLGLVGLLNIDLITMLMGGLGLVKIVHVLIGVSAVWVLVNTLTTHHTVET